MAVMSNINISSAKVLTPVYRTNSAKIRQRFVDYWMGLRIANTYHSQVRSTIHANKHRIYSSVDNFFGIEL